jgi:hypothetical protein
VRLADAASERRADSLAVVADAAANARADLDDGCADATTDAGDGLRHQWVVVRALVAVLLESLRRHHHRHARVHGGANAEADATPAARLRRCAGLVSPLRSVRRVRRRRSIVPRLRRRAVLDARVRPLRRVRRRRHNRASVATACHSRASATTSAACAAATTRRASAATACRSRAPKWTSAACAAATAIVPRLRQFVQISRLRQLRRVQRQQRLHRLRRRLRFAAQVRLCAACATAPTRAFSSARRRRRSPCLSCSASPTLTAPGARRPAIAAGDVGTPVYDEKFNFDNPSAQLAMLELMQRLSNSTPQLVAGQPNSFMPVFLRLDRQRARSGRGRCPSGRDAAAVRVRRRKTAASRTTSCSTTRAIRRRRWCRCSRTRGEEATADGADALPEQHASGCGARACATARTRSTPAPARFAAYAVYQQWEALFAKYNDEVGDAAGAHATHTSDVWVRVLTEVAPSTALSTVW